MLALEEGVRLNNYSYNGGRVLILKGHTLRRVNIKIESSIHTEYIEDPDTRTNMRVCNKSTKEEENILLVIVHKRLTFCDLYIKL